VPDAASIATIRFLEQQLGRRCGGSTGTNVYGCLQLAKEMAAAGEKGAIVTLICDSGERYQHTYFNDQWCQQQGLELTHYLDEVKQHWFG
jgi:cysteine synthase A